MKFWTATVGLISLSIFYIFNFKNEINLSIDHGFSSNYSNVDTNVSGSFSNSKEIENRIVLAITDHWFIGGILLGVFIFIILMSIISLINSIFLIYKYSKSEKDKELLFNLIGRLRKGEEIKFMDSNDSIKISLLHLYNLKISE
ncbi:hypothetical protein [Candidatus Methanoperedens sp. BLZ2]|nr:hypothetical protein [Candidatus Methanoperedens sp. BLZ2]MBZ0173674.1 hypothetical protein [Candidatus Methanoperedens nitroreducens]